MSIYSDKLALIQVLINCPYSIAQIDDVMSYKSLTTIILTHLYAKQILRANLFV